MTRDDTHRGARNLPLSSSDSEARGHQGALSTYPTTARFPLSLGGGQPVVRRLPVRSSGVAKRPEHAPDIISYSRHGEELVEVADHLFVARWTRRRAATLPGHAVHDAKAHRPPTMQDARGTQQSGQTCQKLIDATAKGGGRPRCGHASRPPVWAWKATPMPRHQCSTRLGVAKNRSLRPTRRMAGSDDSHQQTAGRSPPTVAALGLPFRASSKGRIGGMRRERAQVAAARWM
jgi:hypothetical protein